ncbi:ribosome silencing factor [Brevundimonas aveniformis]|uniref:ribosome silencing factor n=1 Tax=Brevundimonas aveniformis TaxID=370977 RepID=UPI00146FC3A9|nr:ribosome silencing factor [Brevundimonas aveniformis]
MTSPSAQDAQAPAVSNAAREAQPIPAVRSEDGPLEDIVLKKLEDDKAEDIVVIDLKGKSSMADTMIVASGRSHRHVGAIADHLLRALKDAGEGRARVEGLPHCDWVLIDAGDLIIHLFRPEVRAFYNIEKIWAVDAGHRAGAAG